MVLIGIIWGAVIAQTRFERQEAIATAIKQNANLAVAFEQYAIRTIQSADAVIQHVKRNYAGRSTGIDTAKFMADTALDNKLFTAVSIVDQRGDVVISTAMRKPTKLLNVADREHFIFHMQQDSGQLFIGKPVVSRTFSRPSIPIARRVNNSDGSFGGMVTVQIEPTRFTEFYQEAAFRQRDVITLVGLDGITRARRVGPIESAGEDFSAGAVFTAQAKHPIGNFFVISKLDRVPRFFSFRTLRDYPLIITVGASETDILADYFQRKTRYYWVAGLVSALIALFAALLMAALARQKRAIAAVTSNEARFRATLDQAAVGVIQTTLKGRILQANQKLRDLLGYSEKELQARTFEDITHPDDMASSVARMKLLATGQSVAPLEKRYLRKDGAVAWVEIVSALVRDARGQPDSYITMIEDITARRHAEERLRRLTRARTVRAECTRVLVHATDETQLLRDMCTRVVECGGYPFAWVGFAEHDEFKSVRPIAQAGGGEKYLREARFSWGDDEFGRCSAGQAIRGGQPCVIQNVITDPDLAPWHELAREYGFSSVISLPLFKGNVVYAALIIHGSEIDAFDAEEIGLLEELAADISYGVLSLRTQADHARAEAKLRESEQLMRATFENAAIGIAHTAMDGRHMLVNQKLCDMLGYTREELLALKVVDVTSPQGRGLNEVQRARLMAGEIATYSTERRYLHKDGSPVWVNRSASLVRDAAGSPLYFIRIIEDITERKVHEDRIEYLATHDALTNLPNRNLFNDRVTQAINRAERAGLAVGVLFLDLDHFKYVNDGYGHPTGDALLKVVAEHLQAMVRKADTVARIGGDEFVILLSDLKNPIFDATTVARKVLDKFSQPLLVAGREFTVTASVGISLYPADGQDSDALLMNADAAMYRAKDSGRNGFQFYAPEMSSKALERVSLEAALRRALELEQFELHYQPQVLMSSGEITGMEALIRWRHPEKGMISPVTFIPVAEQTGLIVAIGEWVLRTACAQNKAWQQAGQPPLTVSVNLSALQLRQAGLVTLVSQILESTGLEPRYLDLELTESMVMGETESVIARLRGLKALGISLSMDDFGTGYSNLSYLQRFPLDQLKIDKSFVRDLPANKDAASIVRAIVSMARSLGLRVVAEGVETDAQAQFLLSVRCEHAQGYLYSKPLPSKDFEEWVRPRKAKGTTTAPLAVAS
jgi:diguanylate cyclase (GGDEF)-like protein/PAS domain S-box-containing protein